jgi:hypothetical protein
MMIVNHQTTKKNKRKKINKMSTVTLYLSTTLNVNELNFPTKRYRMAEWIKK